MEGKRTRKTPRYLNKARLTFIDSWLEVNYSVLENCRLEDIADGLASAGCQIGKNVLSRHLANKNVWFYGCFKSARFKRHGPDAFLNRWKPDSYKAKEINSGKQLAPWHQNGSAERTKTTKPLFEKKRDNHKKTRIGEALKSDVKALCSQIRTLFKTTNCHERKLENHVVMIEDIASALDLLEHRIDAIEEAYTKPKRNN